MTRREFSKMCGLLGISVPLSNLATSCNTNENLTPSDIKKVLIIGAGTAGLTSGYLLKQRGIDFEILEASSTYGGRMKRNDDFTDFPIPLGAEWIHVDRSILNEIVNDQGISIGVQTINYNPDNYTGLFEGVQISLEEMGFSDDLKFVNSTWFDFFKEYILPSVSSKITYDQIVVDIDYSGEQVVVNSQNEEYKADVVIVTIPVKQMQKGVVNFTPSLSVEKQEAFNNITVWDGCKAFIKFSEKFYPTFTAFDIQPETAGQKLYYDAAYGQNTSDNILGLFAVGSGTLPYVQLTDELLIAFMLEELDELYDGQASATYEKHIFQNWNEEPFINGAYIYNHENWRRVRTIGTSVNGKLFFAGTGYTEGEDWSSVHTAARSAKRAVDAVTG